MTNDEFTGENSDLNEVKNRRIQRSKNIPLEIDYEFIPNNPYSITVDSKGFGQSNIISEEKYKPGFFETAKEELKEFNVTGTILGNFNDTVNNPNFISGLKKTLPSNKLPGVSIRFPENEVSPFQDIPPSGWTPKRDPSKLVNIQPQYLAYLMESTGPKDLDYRVQRVREEQYHDEVLANGSTLAKLLGGLTGIVTDPMSYVPIAGLAKYGKFSSSILKNAAQAFPGAATYAVIQSAADQANKINGNLQDFVINSAINSVFGTAIFGGAGAASLALEKMNLWNLRGLAKEYIDGIDFKLKVDEKGKLVGLQAFDESGTLSAAKISFAQDLADSSFDKSGLFKVPYLGSGLFKLMTMPILGTPLPKLLNNHYKTVRGIVDRFVDHNIITSGIRQGRTPPVKFETLMNQEYSSLRSLEAQITSLHLERNGFDISSRPIQSLAEIGLTAKNKSAELLGKDLDKDAYISKEQFFDEITQSLISKQSSEHSAVNDAARLLRDKIDNTYKAWRKAYNLPEDWIPQNILEGYVMRVYDTPYMNVNEEKWVSVISDYLRDSDNVITNRMEPILQSRMKLNSMKENHEDLMRSGMIGDKEQKMFSSLFNEASAQHRLLEEQLQNELRSNPEFFHYVEDWNALSSNEANEIKKLNSPIDSINKKIEKQKNEISKIKNDISKGKYNSLKNKTKKSSESNLYNVDKGKNSLEKAELKLNELEEQLYKEKDILQSKLHNGEINPRLYFKEKESGHLKLKENGERLKFRKVYESHLEREYHAKAYYDTIMNQTAEDTINQVMGKINGSSENHLKSRTLNVPDKILYENNFMSKDLMAKTSNYVTYLSRRTHLKNVFNDVTLDGGFEPILENLNKEFLFNRQILNEKKKNLDEVKDAKEIKKIDNELVKERKEFEKAKKSVNHLYEKMMGIKKQDRFGRQIQSGVMSVTATANLALVPLSMITDLGAMGLQHGVWPFIKDGVYPVVESLFGVLKTKDSESLRKTAPNLDLALQDVLTGYQDKNWSMHTEPYLNLGKIVGGLENIAHFSSNATLTNYIDNGLQRVSSALSQGEFMRILHAYKDGTMTKSEGLYLRQYGIDYEKWADRMIEAFKKDGGGKTKVGGYQSLFWRWQDLEAANEFSRAVFRSVKSTNISRGAVDSPFWADNIMGSLIHGFNGWTYASLNRYVIPSMQKADAQTLIGVTFMIGMGYFVSPLRRLAKGEEPFPANQTDTERMYEAINDSGYFSYFSKILSDANLLSGDNLLGDLKSDKYRDRTRVGLLGPSFSQANRMSDVISAAASNEMNKSDLKKMARMIPVVNSSWAWWMSKKLIDGLEIPETRAQAKSQKNAS